MTDREAARVRRARAQIDRLIDAQLIRPEPDLTLVAALRQAQGDFNRRLSRSVVAEAGR